MINRYFIRFLFVFALFSAVFNGSAQRSASTWVFGNHTGLNFLTTPPTPFNTAISAPEGSSAISNGEGKLLFYSNGIRVFNAKHEVMANGDGIAGELSSTSNSVIVPMPQNDTLYYLFTVGAANNIAKPFTYSIINMKADNGFGAVIEKNTEIASDAIEKLAAVRHCNKRDVWLVIKRWESNEYACYLLSPTGFNMSPVVSATTLHIGGDELNSIGSLKFSANGKKVAAAYGRGANTVELMDFNNATGVISNPIIISPNDNTPSLSFRGVYGIEFSPNGNLLYVSSNNNSVETAMLYQFDISSHNPATIMGSRQQLSNRSDWFGGALQMGPDRKIYYCLWQDTALSLIDKPDVYGPGCTLLSDKIKLPTLSESGLTSYIASDVIAEYAAYDFFFTRSPDCTDRSVTFNLNYNTDVDSVKWNFGDGVLSQALAPVHQFSGAGPYTVTVEIFTTNCIGVNSVKVSRPLTIETGVTTLPADTSFCTGNAITLKPVSKGTNNLWSNAATSDTLLVSTPGLYWLQSDINGCTSRDSINVTEKNITRLKLGNDTTVCAEKPVIISAGAGNSYLWNNGVTASSITVSEPGVFWLQSNAANCVLSDTVHVNWGNCDIYFPSAFSPNGDGRNETFGLLRGTNMEKYELTIFNRWGEIAFHSTDYLQRWDGTTRSKKQPFGTYPWIMRFKTKKGTWQIVKGTVVLIR